MRVNKYSNIFDQNPAREPLKEEWVGGGGLIMKKIIEDLVVMGIFTEKLYSIYTLYTTSVTSRIGTRNSAIGSAEHY